VCLVRTELWGGPCDVDLLDLRTGHWRRVPNMKVLGAACSRESNLVAFVTAEDTGTFLRLEDLDRMHHADPDPFAVRVLSWAGRQQETFVVAKPASGELASGEFVVVSAGHSCEVPGLGVVWDPLLDLVHVRADHVRAQPEAVLEEESVRLQLRRTALLHRPLVDVKFIKERLCGIVLDVNESLCLDLQTSEVLAREKGQCFKFGDRALFRYTPEDWREIAVFDPEGRTFSKPAKLIDLQPLCP
jgi:hypothetical protein